MATHEHKGVGQKKKKARTSGLHQSLLDKDWMDEIHWNKTRKKNYLFTRDSFLCQIKDKWIYFSRISLKINIFI